MSVFLQDEINHRSGAAVQSPTSARFIRVTLKLTRKRHIETDVRIDASGKYEFPGRIDNRIRLNRKVSPYTKISAT